MNQTEIEKLKRFISDPTMSEAVRKVLTNVFLKKRDGDVHILAAQTLAYSFVEEAWHELAKYKVEDVQAAEGGNLGL